MPLLIMIMYWTCDIRPSIQSHSEINFLNLYAEITNQCNEAWCKVSTKSGCMQGQVSCPTVVGSYTARVKHIYYNPQQWSCRWIYKRVPSVRASVRPCTQLLRGISMTRSSCFKMDRIWLKVIFTFLCYFFPSVLDSEAIVILMRIYLHINIYN